MATFFNIYFVFKTSFLAFIFSPATESSIFPGLSPASRFQFSESFPAETLMPFHWMLPPFLRISSMILTFTHFLFFTIHFPFLFVLQSKDFIVFLQKNQKTYQMKRNKKAFYTLLYIVGFINIWLMPLQVFGSIKSDGKRLSAKNGLPCNTVNDIIQDRDGFIWLGTPNEDFEF